MGMIPLIRQGVLGSTTLFSLIVLAISAHLISQTQQYFRVTATFCSLALANAVISLVTLPVMLAVDFLRRGAFTSMVAVELVWLSVLWILWVAVAGETVSEYSLIFGDGCEFDSGVYNGMCQETQAIEAFSFLNFIIIMLYTGLLFVMAVIAAGRGRSVWLSSVKESFGAPGGPAAHPMTQYDASVPPQPPVAHLAGPHHGQRTADSTQPVAPGQGAVMV